MVHLNRLLTATDLSAPARHAADRAALVAASVGATLDLAHVANLAWLDKLRRLLADIPAELEAHALDAAREEMDKLAAILMQHHGISAGVHVTSGPVVPELAKLADGMPADLIVLGARGASFMRRLLLGSTAERLVRRATRPTLVVKQAAHERYRTVLVPVDFSAVSQSAIRCARAVAPDADIVLLHAFEVPFEGQLQFAGVDESMIHRYRIAAKQEALQKMEALCGEAGLSPQETSLVVLHGDPSQHIVEQEQEQDCDLIVMGKHGEGVVEELLLGSVTKHVLAESQCDVLVSV